VLDVTWAQESNAVYLAGCNSTLKYWNLATPAAPPQDLGRHAQPIRCVHRAFVGQTPCLVTGSWDRTLKYWDPRQPKQFAEVRLDERVYAMDVNRNSMVVALGGSKDRKVLIFDLQANPAAPLWTLPQSPLKFQTRCVRIFNDISERTGRPQSFGISSIEGRCAIRRLDQAEDSLQEPSAAGVVKLKHSFAFKCHREEPPAQQGRAPPPGYIYAVNALDCHPMARHAAVFATGGSDGSFTFWDKDKRQRLKEFQVQPQRNPKTPVTDMKFSPLDGHGNGGSMFAYALSYDWSKGHEHNNPQNNPPQLFVHSIVEEGELRRKV